MTIVTSGGTMSFLKAATKSYLKQEELLNTCFYTAKEIANIAALEEFHSWNTLGYYRKIQVPKLVDIPAVLLNEEVTYVD